MLTSPSAKNALPFQFLNPRFRQFYQEVFDRLPFMSSGHFYLPRRYIGGAQLKREPPPITHSTARLFKSNGAATRHPPFDHLTASAMAAVGLEYLLLLDSSKTKSTSQHASHTPGTRTKCSQRAVNVQLVAVHVSKLFPVTTSMCDFKLNERIL
jgi:hypothetical protein